MNYKDHELYRALIDIIRLIFEALLLWAGINFVFVGSLGLVFVSNWYALILLLMLLIGIFLIIRCFKIIKKVIFSSNSK